MTRGSTITQDTEFESQRSSVWVVDSSDSWDEMDDADRTVEHSDLPLGVGMDNDEAHEVEPYHFSGVFHRFSTGRISVSCVKFAIGEDHIVALGTGVGAVMFCLNLAAAGGPQYDRLDGHRATVTELEWTEGNRYLVSSALDKNWRVWDVIKRVCARSVAEESPCLCLSLFPTNNNLLVVSYMKPGLKVYNLSTGKCLKRTSAKLSMGCIAWGTADIVYCGDAGGTLTMLSVNTITCEMRRLTSITLEKNKPVTSLTYQTVSVETAPKVKGVVGTLLCRVRANLVALLHCVVNTENPTLSSFTILRRVQVQHTLGNLRAVPSAHKDKGLCSVAGSEDGNVYIHNLTRLKVQCVAKVVDPKSSQYAINCVALNASESLLACGNAKGELVLWHRMRFDELMEPLSGTGVYLHLGLQSECTATFS